MDNQKPKFKLPEDGTPEMHALEQRGLEVMLGMIQPYLKKILAEMEAQEAKAQGTAKVETPQTRDT